VCSSDLALTLKRIRRERGIVARPSQAARAEARPVVSRTEEAPHPSPAPAATATEAGAAPDTPTPVPAVRERRAIAPVGAKLPDDWLTADLTREQKRLLTPAPILIFSSWLVLIPLLKKD
jgi:hypothetical protein